MINYELKINVTECELVILSNSLNEIGDKENNDLLRNILILIARVDNKEIVIKFSLHELDLIRRALLYVLSTFCDSEFAIRIGQTKCEAFKLLHKLDLS